MKRVSKPAKGKKLAPPKKSPVLPPTTTLTASSRSTFIRCRRRYYYSYEQRLTPKGVTVPFVVGGLFHSILEQWYTEKGMPNVTAAIRTINDGIREARASALGNEKQLEQLETSHSMLIGMIRAYHTLYMVADKKNWIIKAAEVPFEIQLDNVWKVSGKIDLLVEIKKKLWIVEHKTTSVLNEDYVGRLPLDDQIHQYYLGAEHVLGVAPAGVIYNVVQKSRLRMKKDETFDQLCRRIESDYSDDPSRYFWRGVLQLPDWSVKRYRESLPIIIRNIEDTRVRSRTEEVMDQDPRNSWYMNTNHCFQYGSCPFVGLCSAPDDKTARLMFTQRKDHHPELEEKEAEL